MRMQTTISDHWVHVEKHAPHVEFAKLSRKKREEAYKMVREKKGRDAIVSIAEMMNAIVAQYGG